MKKQMPTDREITIDTDIQKWSKFVDIVTITWLCIFVIGYFSMGKVANICNLLNIAILSVFIVDLILIYRKSDNWYNFLTKNWFNILMVVPYFRVFRIFRMFKVLRLFKFMKIIKVGKAIKITMLSHESFDLIRTIKKRLLRKG